MAGLTGDNQTDSDTHVIGLSHPGAIEWLRHAVRAAIVLSVGSVVALALILRVGPERVLLFSVVQYAPFPLLLLPLIVVVGCSLALSWPWRLASALAAILAVTVVMGLEVHAGERGSNRLRILTFNVKDYITLRDTFGLADIANEIARHDPDIFVLQDARSFDERVHESGAAGTVYGTRHTYSFGQYVVASRFPLRDCRNGWISFREETHTYATCVVAFSGAEFDLVTAHFITPRFGLAATRYNPLLGLREWKQNVDDRMTQAATLAADLRRRTRPVIVAGDLNAPESSLVVQTLVSTGLRDTFSVAGRGYGYTWGHSLRLRFPFLRIDHILVSAEFRVARSFVGGSAGSAHRVVVADLVAPLTPH